MTFLRPDLPDISGVEILGELEAAEVAAQTRFCSFVLGADDAAGTVHISTGE